MTHCGIRGELTKILALDLERVTPHLDGPASHTPGMRRSFIRSSIKQIKQIVLNARLGLSNSR